MKSMLSAAAMAAATLCASAPAGAAIVVSFDPASSSIAIGDSISVAMRISGLGDEILSALDINLLFSNAIVGNDTVTHDVTAQWPDPGFSTSVGFGAGDTDVYDDSNDVNDEAIAAVQANDFTVLTFTFTGLADGASFLKLGADPDFERNFVGRRAESLDVQIQSACIAVGTGSCAVAVPEPASYGLAGIALLAAAVAGRSRRRPESVPD
jgi:hypothetical protein